MRGQAKSGVADEQERDIDGVGRGTAGGEGRVVVAQAVGRVAGLHSRLTTPAEPKKSLFHDG